MIIKPIKKRNMKIAFVYDVIYPYVIGGGQKRIWEIARRLAHRGHEVHVFGMKHWEGQDTIVKEGVHLRGFCQPRGLYDNERRTISEAIEVGCKVLPPLLKERFDIIDCQEFPYFPCFSSKIASVYRNQPLVITWYEVWDNYWYDYLGKKGVFGKLIEKLVTKLSSITIAISEQVKEELIAIGMKSNGIKVVPDGLDFKAIQAVKSNCNNKYDLLYSGRLAEHKNVDKLIEATSLLKNTIPNIRLGITGDGPERRRLEKLGIELQLEENIEFLGFLEKDEEVISHMKSSSVFVLPSTREGGGLVTLEANACGLPVVAIDHSANAAKEVVINGKNGFLSKLTVEDLAMTIQHALNNHERMTSKCIEFARQYDWNRMAELTETVYEEVYNTV